MPRPQPPAGQAEARPPVTVKPQASWADGILYFVIVDRFADGDPRNDSGVDRAAKGTFHGGDLAGLRRGAVALKPALPRGTGRYDPRG
jgi:hypothetical protein